MYESGEREQLRPAFDIAERCLSSGSAEACDAIVLGLFEAIQNIASHRSYGAEVFVPYLGIRSRQAWHDLNIAWQGKESVIDVVAAERGVSVRKPWWQFWRRDPSPRELLDKIENPKLRAIIEAMTREAPRK